MVGVVRTLTPDDVPSAMELSIAANWNQTAEDWHRLIRLSPDDCRCIESDGRIAATATRFNYGNRLAWIGMVLTRPENRHRGYARCLMEDTIGGAENHGTRTLKLDATDQGRPLYASLGFVVENTIERWEREGDAAAAGAAAASVCRFPEGLLALDAKAFGVSREELLQDLSASANSEFTSSGYVQSRAGRVARYLGPCVAASANDAQALIAGELNGYPTSAWYWDLLTTNAEAVRCAQELGFKRSRVLWRMRRGEEIQNDDSLVYAIAGFELG